ncbi:hypothetical protein [Paenibacillus sabinae]|uniref:hypothetical protein n=1 Tax=Paenibacillus sabinae TaxID=365617 RepID=UPI00046CFD2B|nr:hypothetical protein [Paenibacillus sabinae]
MKMKKAGSAPQKISDKFKSLPVNVMYLAEIPQGYVIELRIEDRNSELMIRGHLIPIQDK